MMSDKAVPDNATRLEWEKQFNDFDSVKVIGVEKTTKTDQFQVTLEVKVNPRAAARPIPDYGYSESNDVRFVQLVRDNQDRWKIEEIATGP